MIGSQRVALNNSFDVFYNDNTFADVTDQEDPPDSRQEHVCNCASGPSSFFLDYIHPRVFSLQMKAQCFDGLSQFSIFLCFWIVFVFFFQLGFLSC